jgi:four helix bundle protein
METKQIKSAKDLRVYKKAYTLAMEIFHISKQWPSEERFSLTDQIRRSSRSVCANLREAWAKRRYEAHFISKLTDADGENSEIDTWLDLCHFKVRQKAIVLKRNLSRLFQTLLLAFVWLPCDKQRLPVPILPRSPVLHLFDGQVLSVSIPFQGAPV